MCLHDRSERVLLLNSELVRHMIVLPVNNLEEIELAQGLEGVLEIYEQVDQLVVILGLNSLLGLVLIMTTYSWFISHRDIWLE